MTFDAVYLTTLSADAAPVLFEALPDIPEEGLQIAPHLTAEQVLLERWKGGDTGWRTWNLSRERARRLAEAYAIAHKPSAESDARASKM